jgi:hypothetical protein
MVVRQLRSLRSPGVEGQVSGWKRIEFDPANIQQFFERIQSTDHELIPARNASLSAMQGSVSGSNVRYYPT